MSSFVLPAPEQRRLEAAEVRAAACRTGWLFVLSALAADRLGPALQRPGRHAPCPIHNGRHGDGFRLFANVDATGGGICATCGAFPDGLALLQWLFGWSFPEVLRQIAAVLGYLPDAVPARAVRMPPGHRLTVRDTTDADAQRARSQLHRVWSEALSPDHPEAEPLRRYLAWRGLETVALDARVVRLHPALAYWHGDTEGHRRCLGRFPALLARVCAADGRALTLHRTYLRADGQGKAEVPCPRKLMPAAASGVLSGGAIRLAAPDRMLGIAEGLETALAAAALSGMPVWSCMSATLLERFRPPAGIEQLTVWADRDRSGAGLRAAERLHARLSASVVVRLVLPPGPIPDGAKSLDWADVWRQRQDRSLSRAA
ncbi:MAG: toprim domain-containing protein [Chromatiaceae bacterium]|nr:toprim domain-containing protein [Chromatiaceae bacterium]